MYKGTITTTTAVTASTNIPFTTALNTNSNTSYDSTANAVKIQNPGYYDITANLYVTNVAVGNITAQLYANGTAIPEAICGATSGATTDVITLPLTDIMRVIPSSTSTSDVEISVRTSVACSVTAGVFEVEKRK